MEVTSSGSPREQLVPPLSFKGQDYPLSLHPHIQTDTQGHEHTHTCRHINTETHTRIHRDPRAVCTWTNLDTGTYTCVFSHVLLAAGVEGGGEG